ncbi:MAG: serine protease [Deltaproteobacteria bacterium]
MARVLAGSVCLLGAVACGGSEFAGIGALEDAPEPVRTRRSAVVRIRVESSHGGGSGTGFFIKGPYFVTNAHVLGPEECGRPGCWVDIRSDYEIGREAKDQYMFMEPYRVDVANDVAVYVPHLSEFGAPYEPPAIVDVANFTTPEVGDRVHVVGHPFATLKKWSHGEVYDHSSEGVWAEATVAPGNSGSPVFDDEGRFVGVATLMRFVVGDGEVVLDTFATGPRALVALTTSTSTTPAFPELVDLEDDEAISRHEVHLFNSGTSLVSNRQVPEVLLDVCDQAMASSPLQTRADAIELYRRCVVPVRWFDCEDEPFPTTTCDQSAANQWRIRIAGFAELVETLSPGAFLAAHYELRRIAGQLQNPPYWEAIQPVAPELEAPYSIDDAVRELAWAITRDREPADWAIDAIEDYDDVPGYEREGTRVMQGMIMLRQGNRLDDDELKSKLGGLYRDRSIDLVGHLDVEAALYDFGWSDEL